MKIRMKTFIHFILFWLMSGHHRKSPFTSIIQSLRHHSFCKSCSSRGPRDEYDSDLLKVSLSAAIKNNTAYAH